MRPTRCPPACECAEEIRSTFEHTDSIAGQWWVQNRHVCCLYAAPG